MLFLCPRRDEPHEHGADLARAVHPVPGRGGRGPRRHRRGHQRHAARHARRRHPTPLRQQVVRQDRAGEGGLVDRWKNDISYL